MRVSLMQCIVTGVTLAKTKERAVDYIPQDQGYRQRDQIWAKFRHLDEILILWQSFVGLFNHWHNVDPTLEKIFSNESKFFVVENGSILNP